MTDHKITLRANADDHDAARRMGLALRRVADPTDASVRSGAYIAAGIDPDHIARLDAYARQSEITRRTLFKE